MEQQQALNALNQFIKTVKKTETETVKSSKKISGALETFKGVLGAQAVVSGLKAIGRAATGY